MRMMGADSVAYHQATVIGRADDHPGQALAYYASRGETPLVWGGSGAARLGLSGAVTEAQYSAMYGPGGACDPTTGARLVVTRRPGMEIVISAHKSVAELGVIGRADDMHRIMDAERDATMAHLDEVTRERGGRRTRSRTPAPTGGLVYAHTRHATSRAGDPSPHDHVLVANLVEMTDGAGRWKAPDTALWRDHLHAATMIGRVAAARVSVELGYAIEADRGPSGRLGHWRIAGIPDEVCELHSKRAAEIEAEVARTGRAGYQARNDAARDTRKAKRQTPVGELMPRWRAEAAEAGWTVERLSAAVDDAARTASVRPTLGYRDLTALTQRLVVVDGPLACKKVFSALDITVAAAPHLYGRPVEDLDRVVRHVLRSAEVVPLVGVNGARERMYATASTLAVETAIADMVTRGAGDRTGAPVPTGLVESGLVRATARLGGPLTQGQLAAVRGICGQPRRVQLVLGVAGSGKTTALRAVAEAHRAAGYEVVGTATSGQAAQTLGREADLDHARTLASLLCHLDHGRLTLGPRTLILLDEAGMTDDPDMLGLLGAAEVAKAKVVLVGDDRQLAAVGPGGALRGLFDRHGHAVHILDENIRQPDPEERAALAELRSGDVAQAVAWYVEHDRVQVSTDRDTAVQTVVDAWLNDTLAGHHTAMYAWRRTNVDELNVRARHAWALNGNLNGPHVTGPDGRAYAADDRIVTLAPGEGGRLVTSERGTITAVHTRAQTFTARMDDGRLHEFARAEMTKDRLAWGYAITVHRSQGDTVDRAHRLADDGGRELAYVSMSRARQSTTVHVVADDLDQAAEDLVRDWSHERRPRWAIDSGTPATTATDVETHPGVPVEMRAALSRARLDAERRAIARAVPPDVNPVLWRVEANLRQTQQDRRDIETGHGRYADTEIGQYASDLRRAEQRQRQAKEFAGQSDMGWRDRRYWRKEAKLWEAEAGHARQAYDLIAMPEIGALNASIDDLNDRRAELQRDSDCRSAWMADHPEAAHRLRYIDQEIEALDIAGRPEGFSQELAAGLGAARPHGIDRSPDLGIDLGL